MKKIFSIISIFTLFKCKNMEQKIWNNISDFLNFEQKATVKSHDAIKIFMNVRLFA